MMDIDDLDDLVDFFYNFQVETKYEEERENVQQELLQEQNQLLEKYKAREVSVIAFINWMDCDKGAPWLW